MSHTRRYLELQQSSHLECIIFCIHHRSASSQHLKNWLAKTYIWWKIPEHQIDMLALSWQSWIPWRSWYSLLSFVSLHLWRDNNTIVMQKKLKVLTNYQLSSRVSFLLSGHSPWQYSMRVERVESECCAWLYCLSRSLLAGSWAMWADMSSSASSSRSWSYNVEVLGIRDSVSAMLKFFPGTWWILYLNWSMRRWSLRICGGKLSSCFLKWRGTRGLWFVSMVIFLPRI